MNKEALVVTVKQDTIRLHLGCSAILHWSRGTLHRAYPWCIWRRPTGSELSCSILILPTWYLLPPCLLWLIPAWISVKLTQGIQPQSQKVAPKMATHSQTVEKYMARIGMLYLDSRPFCNPFSKICCCPRHLSLLWHDLSKIWLRSGFHRRSCRVLWSILGMVKLQ